MNKIILSGNLVADPELKFAAGTGNAVSKFRIAVKKQYKKDGEPEADFFSCVSFGKTAETIASYFVKGKPILIEGHVNTGSYEKDGVKHFTFDIFVERFEFIGGNAEGKEDKKSSSKNKGKNTKNKENEDMTPIDDDLSDIPF